MKWKLHSPKLKNCYPKTNQIELGAYMANRFKEIAEGAAKKTNITLDNELAQITTLPSAQYKKLLPKKSDKEKFAKLMAIVDGQTSRNKKIAEIENNITDFSELILRIAGKLT